MSRRTLRVLAVVAAGALGACSDDGTGPETELTEAEAAVLAEAVMQAAIFTTAEAGVGPANAGPMRAPYSTEVDVSFTAECPLGGTVEVDGEVRAQGDDETGEGTIELDVQHEHHGCMVESDEGVVFTFDGSPQLAFDLSLELTEEEVAWSGALVGGLEWSHEGRDGRCNVDLHFDGLVSGVEEVLEISVAGTVCRQAVELSWSLSLSETA